MKILVIRNYPSYMEVRNNTYNIQEVGLAKALTKRGHQCDVLFWTDKEDRRVQLSCCGKKINIYYKKGITILKNTVFLGCEEFFRKYDILQPCEYNQLESWHLARKYRNKTVIYHGPYYSDFNKKYNWMCRIFDLFFLKRYKRNNTPFIVKSRLAEEFLRQKGICNITVAGVGIDQDMLTNNSPNKGKTNFFRIMQSDTDKIKILYIGKLEKRRNILFLLDIFNELRSKLKNVRLYMIGSGDKSYTDKVWQKIRRLHLSDLIVYKERMEQKDLSDIYKLADFFILPTEYEIFGMVLLEAMNYGTVCVTNQNGGSDTLIENGKNGIIVNKKITVYWAEAIKSLVKEPELMNSIKAAARVTIHEHYTWDAIAGIFIEKYKELLN